MSGLRSEKRCLVLNVHESHDWGEVDHEFWFCPGILSDEEHDQRVADLDSLAQDYEDLERRVWLRQLRSLKEFFEEAFREGGNGKLGYLNFEEWWQKFIAEREAAYQKGNEDG